MGVFVAGPLNSSDVVKGDDWGIHLNDSSKDGYFDATDTRHHYCRGTVLVTSETEFVVVLPAEALKFGTNM